MAPSVFTYRRMVPEARVYVAGHNGLVGSAILRRLRSAGYRDVITRDRTELDLTRQADTEAFFAATRPEFVILAAARVGGIHANDTLRADFIRDNLLIQSHVVDAAYRSGVQRLLFLGSSCIYPRDCPQPIEEAHLMTGPLERTNEPYAIAKIAGLTLCDALNAQHGTRYLSVMPTNLYGPNDSYDLQNSHVLPALIRKFHEAKAAGAATVTVWGTGRPRREFLHVDDLADAVVFLLEQTDETALINIGTGTDLSIEHLAQLIGEIVGYAGSIVYDPSRPDGTPRKLLDVTRLRSLGWQPAIALRGGIGRVYAEFVAASQAKISGDKGKYFEGTVHSRKRQA